MGWDSGCEPTSFMRYSSESLEIGFSAQTKSVLLLQDLSEPLMEHNESSIPAPQTFVGLGEYFME